MFISLRIMLETESEISKKLYRPNATEPPGNKHQYHQTTNSNGRPPSEHQYISSLNIGQNFQETYRLFPTVYTFFLTFYTIITFHFILWKTIKDRRNKRPPPEQYYNVMSSSNNIQSTSRKHTDFPLPFIPLKDYQNFFISIPFHFKL